MDSKKLPYIPSFDVNEKVLSSKTKLEWVEASVNISDTGTEEFLGTTVDNKKNSLFFIFIVIIIVIGITRCFYLQIIHGEDMVILADKNKIRTNFLQSKRGIIYDKQGQVIANNTSIFNIILTPQDLSNNQQKRDDQVKQISEITGISFDQIQEKINSKKNSDKILLQENIDYNKALLLEINSISVAGLNLEIAAQRIYPLNKQIKSLSHILGYTGTINEQEVLKYKNYKNFEHLGKSGLELSYEAILRGQPGEEDIEVDALGKEKNILSQNLPQDGQDVFTSLDVKAQQKLENIVFENLIKNKKNNAVAIISSPKTGEILSAVSWPSYDSNDFITGLDQDAFNKLLNDKNKPLYNRIVSGLYPSGSTIKPVVALAGLQEGIIARNTVVNSTGGIRVNQWYYPDWKNGGHGITNVTKALAESVNTFFYLVGGGFEDFKGLGVNKLIYYLKKFNIDKKTGVDLPGEQPGFIPSPEWKQKEKNEIWYTGDTYHLSIGQGDLLVSPLQINVMTNVVANEGYYFAPHFVSHSQETKTGQKNYLKYDKYFIDGISKQNYDIVRSGLRSAVLTGSAKKLLKLPVSSAGKTGTAQWGTDKLAHAWFTGWAPYENPDISITVLVEEGEEGSKVAIDIAKDFLDWYFTEYKK